MFWIQNHDKTLVKEEEEGGGERVQPGVVAYSPGSLGAEAGAFQVQSQPGLYNKPLFVNKNKKRISSESRCNYYKTADIIDSHAFQ